MALTRQTWKEKAAAQFDQAYAWLKRRTRRDTPYLVYGTLCSLSLWPLVEAAQHGDLLPVVMALGSVTAGVGGNLLANQIQSWKEQAAEIDQAGIAAWVAQNAPDNAELRAALDAILEEMEAISQAQRRLEPADRQWFVETLQAELARLGNLPRFQAVLSGTGAMAQGPGAWAATATGGGLAVAGDVKGSLTVIHGSPGQDPAALRTAYLNRVFETSSYLSLSGIDPKAASSEVEARLHLSAVYTALLTLSPEHHDRLALAETPGHDTPRLSALAQLDRQSHLVLLGDPGSGKSTFVNFVAMCLAGQALGRSEANLETLTAPLPNDKGEDEEKGQRWQHGSLLPVRIILRDFAAQGLPPVGERATAEHLWRFVVAGLKSATLDAFSGPLANELLNKGGLLLLDGLDEVPEANQRRSQIKEAIEDFAATFKQCRILVTSRTYAYQKQDWRLPGFAEAVLAPFSRGQIHRFVQRWYEHMAGLRGMDRDNAQGRAALLRQAIFGSSRLMGLAERPLLLTLVASLHAWRGGSLPEKREELYADTVDLLLDWWESPKVVKDAQGRPRVEQPSLAEWLRVERDKVRTLLDELAFQAHTRQPETVGTADMTEDELIGGLIRLSENPDVKPARLVEYLSHRAGLLLPRGVGVFTFPHRTFQEYLAACHLTDTDYPDRVAELARSDPNRWREVALLAGAKAARGAASTIWQLVEALCYKEPPPEGSLAGADAWGAHLAGQALLETANLAQVGERHQAKMERVRRWLVNLLERSALPALERAEAGRNLVRLPAPAEQRGAGGDPRPGVGLREDGLPDFIWCEVEAGPFVMGSDPNKDKRAQKDEQPQHEVILPAYKIAKYPITNAQYGAFVAAGYWQEGQFKGRYDREARSAPNDYGPPFNLPNHPVVGVSWYEAVAFCRWLSEELGHPVRLPTEAEWEKAARGPSTGSGSGRIYPWGDEPDPERANYGDTGLGSTSAVGCFAGGASPYGCEDMSGNVREWCATKEGKPYPYDATEDEWGEDYLKGTDVLRVLRGGSWYDNGGFVRCALRSRYYAFDHFDGIGVRVVSPI